jgi:curved DNA-binding protein CbpA
LLKDISKGKDSPNYHVLKKVAQKEKISEQFIIERAKFILSHFVPSDPKEDYYKILNVSPTASTEEIRSSWLNLVKTYHPDKVGDEGLDFTKRINDAYEILGNPIKKSQYDARRIPRIPAVIISNPWTGVASRKFIYPALIAIVVFTAIFYLAKSGLVPRLSEERGQFAQKTEDKKGYKFEKTKPSTVESLSTPAMNETSIPKRDEKKAALSFSKSSSHIVQSPTRESKKIVIAEEYKKTHRLEETQNQTQIKSQDAERAEIIRQHTIMKKDLLQKQVEEFTQPKITPEDMGHKEVKVIRSQLPDSNRTITGPERAFAQKQMKSSGESAQPEVTPEDASGQTFRLSQTEQKPEFTKEIGGKTEPKSHISYPDKTSLYSFVSNYVSAYKNRDIHLFMSFFEPDARENGVEISKIIPSYTENFSSLEIIGYDVKIKGIDLNNDKAFIDGDYVLVLKNKNDQQERSSEGTISWTLSWQDNKWRIKELNYKLKDTMLKDKTELLVPFEHTE